MCVREILMEFWPSKKVSSDEGMPLLKLVGFPYSMATGCQEPKPQAIKAEVCGFVV